MGSDRRLAEDLQRLGYTEARSWEIVPLFDPLRDIGDRTSDAIFEFKEVSGSLEAFDIALTDLWIKFSLDAQKLISALRKKSK